MIRPLFFIIMCVFNNKNIHSMESLPNTENPITLLSHAEIIASHYQEKDWYNFPLSPYIMAEIIKKKVLCLSTIPSSSEIKIIEETYTHDPTQYQRIQCATYHLLGSSDSLNELQKIEALIFMETSMRLIEKKAQLEHLTKEKKIFTDAYKNNEQFWNSGYIVLIGSIAMLEFLVIATTGIGALNCWYS